MKLVVVQDRQDLDRLEAVISRNLRSSFYEVGSALMEIRNRELYRDVKGYETFESYCKAEWDMSRPRAYQLIDAIQVKENLSTIVDITPSTESQARPLAKLEPEQQRKAWRKAVETAPEGKVTAAHVSKVVKEMTSDDSQSQKVIRISRNVSTGTLTTDRLSYDTAREAMDFAAIAIIQLERIRDDDPRREEALELVSQWITKNKKKDFLYDWQNPNKPPV